MPRQATRFGAFSRVWAYCSMFRADYEATLVDTYGLDYEDSLVVEGGQVK